LALSRPATAVIETAGEGVMAMNDLSDVRQRREALLGAIASIEAALAAPASDARWPEGLGNALSALRTTFEQHVVETEAPDGILDQVRERAPRLSNQIDQLVGEHVAITAGIEHLMDRLDDAPPERTAEETTATREQALQLLAAIVRHRHLGADLLYEAYNVDVGGPG
jgi:iron-sulfur cluster repair protein YtfE (RIC family)